MHDKIRRQNKLNLIHNLGAKIRNTKLTESKERTRSLGLRINMERIICPLLKTYLYLGSFFCGAIMAVRVFPDGKGPHYLGGKPESIF